MVALFVGLGDCFDFGGFIWAGFALVWLLLFGLSVLAW